MPRKVREVVRDLERAGFTDRNAADRYAKVVQWSDEDGCYVGTIPELTHGGCHGPDPRAVFEELCEIAEELAELSRRDGTSLPPPRGVIVNFDRIARPFEKRSADATSPASEVTSEAA